MRRFVSILLAFAFPSAASAASWVFVANCGERDQVRAYSYDRDSVRRDDDNVVVRIRGDYSRFAGSQAQEARLLWSFDCASRTFVEKSRAEYAPGRKVVANYNLPTGRMSITRGSIAEKVYAIVCA